MSAFSDGVAGIFYRLAASGLLPAAWFREVDPAGVDKATRRGKLHLELVSHCWRYSHFLNYQLSSLVRNPTDKLDITMTVFYAEEDAAVREVLDYFGAMDLPGITWNWQALPKESLFRRSIGRNLAAKNTRADWIWFTDCDILFHEGCLAALADALQGRDDSLVFPVIGLGTSLLPDDDPILEKGRQGPQLLEIPIEEFRPYGGERDKAKGPHQITHGDIARACGYCETISLYQTPADRWRKTYEDRAFRWLIGTHGTPLDIPNVCQIRHIAKGRYKKNSVFSRLRAFIRQSQDD